MGLKRKHLSILIPAFNEQQVLPALYDRLLLLAGALTHYDLEFLFINDGSTDQTLAMLVDFARTDPRVSYINLSRNFGKEIAMIAGLDNCDADAVVIIDADLQDPPELIPEMVKYWEQGYDDVYARRASRAGESWLKKKSSRTFYKILQRSTRIKIQADTGDFRLLSRRCVQALRKMRESQRYTKGMFSWIGYHKKEIIYKRDPRAAGVTKWNYAKLIDLAVDGITSFTTFPLRLSAFVGFGISFLAFLYIIVVLVRTLIFGNSVPGYASLLAFILFLGGVQLMSLGIIGEYIARIFNETKQRPLYLVERAHRGSAYKS